MLGNFGKGQGQHVGQVHKATVIEIDQSWEAGRARGRGIARMRKPIGIDFPGMRARPAHNSTFENQGPQAALGQMGCCGKSNQACAEHCYRQNLWSSFLILRSLVVGRSKSPAFRCSSKYKPVLIDPACMRACVRLAKLASLESTHMLFVLRRTDE